MRHVQLLPGVFATPEFGLWFEDESTYVVADLHLGYEAEARAEGAGVPSNQYPVIEARLESIVRSYSPKRLVVAGDLKHCLGRNRGQEWDEVNRLIDLLDGRCELQLLRGNHDNFLVTILRRRGVALGQRARLGRFVIAHGHERIKRPRDTWLAIGHEHPALKVRDRLGASAGAPCFLWSGPERVVVLPALSPIAFGRNVLTEHVRPLSPMLSSFDSFEAAAVQGRGLLRFGGVASLAGGIA